jgi:hypothetical protein
MRTRLVLAALLACAAAHAGQVEICDDGFDNDSNGFADCDDFACTDSPACTDPVEICDDGLDNDSNGFTDCDDFACADSPACAEICNDGIDNDTNGFTDCDDLACTDSPACTEICDDGIDNDSNGFTDCDDLACTDSPACGGPNPALLSCDDEALVSQPPAETTGSPGFSDESDNNLRAYDNFSGLDGPITGLVWWGGGINPSPCTRAQNDFLIGFYADNGGQPGNLVASEGLGSLVGEPTGLGAGFGELMRYEVTFSEPIDLAAGWVSVFAVSDFSGCFFYWANGTGGNNQAYSSGAGAVASDFAFCLLTTPAPHSADQNGDTLISLSELLRVIQFYNSARYGCGVETEDGFAPESTEESCAAHASDYNPQDWRILLSELLRLIQFYNSGGYHPCEEGEDGFCPGQPGP